MMAGVLVSSTVSGRLISKTGSVKPYIVGGTVVLVLGFLGLGMVDHATSLWLIGIAMAVVGTGVGMTMQNLVLAVQNSVPLRDLGSASASVTFFRSLGGTIGVSVLGAVLANRVSADLAAALHAPAGASSTGEVSALNLKALPPEVQQVVHTVYGDATAHIFLISAAVAVIGLIAALFLKPITLRTTIDLEHEDDEAVVSDPIVG
jgi:MFS family permease